MSQQVQELIDKIKLEGVEVADQKAQEIEQLAQSKADKIINDAKAQADQLIVNAKEDVKKLQESTQMALKQSSRDVLLSLRKEIENTLERLVTSQIKDSLTAENLTEIIGTVIKNFLDGSKDANVVLALSKPNVEKLKNGFLAKLQKQLKNPITVQSSDDVGAGFSMSFDSGKSSYDFSDASLAEYLCSYLNEQVSELLKESIN